MSVVSFALEDFEMQPFTSSTGTKRNDSRSGGSGDHRHSPDARCVTPLAYVPGIGSTGSIVLPAIAELARRSIHYQTRGMSR